MPTLARGAAFVDATVTQVTADAGFLRALGLALEDPAQALRDRAAREPALEALLAGRGPSTLLVEAAEGEPLRLERHAGPAGLLLVLRSPGDTDRLEHAARSQALPLLAGGLAHDVNGPLNTMSLQLALLGEKLGGAQEEALASGHLGVLRDQVARVHGVVRRFRELLDPPVPLGGADLATLAAEVVAFLAHDLHRREIRLGIDAKPGAARTQAPPERAQRLVLGLLAHAVSATPDGEALAVSVSGDPAWVTLEVIRPAGARPPDLGYDFHVAASAAITLGGRLARASEDGRERVTLQLPRGRHG